MHDVWILCALIGLFAGFISGLLGVGGGLVIVPVLLYLLPKWGVNADVVAQVAIATSLATIVVTGLSSAFAHHRHQAVVWPWVYWLSPGLLLGAAVGAYLATVISSRHLQLVFGLLMIILSLRMMLKPASKGQALGEASPSASWLCLPTGTGIGIVSALAGIGGGSLTVPFLAKRCMPMANSVAIAAACGVPLAVAGTVTYVVSGLSVSGLPPHSLGYIYLPAFLGVVATSTLTAGFGARLAHRLPASQLKKIFAVFLVLIGFKILYSAW